MLSCDSVIFFFQAEDGIRDLVRSRGLGDVYKRQALPGELNSVINELGSNVSVGQKQLICLARAILKLSLIHI